MRYNNSNADSFVNILLKMERLITENLLKDGGFAKFIFKVFKIIFGEKLF